MKLPTTPELGKRTELCELEDEPVTPTERTRIETPTSGEI